MAVSAGAMTMGAVIVIPFDLVGGQLIEIGWPAESAPYGHFSLLTGTMMQTSRKVICDLLMTGTTLVFIEHGRMPDEITGMRHIFIPGIVYTVMTSSTSY
jgi:hypothetical protein